MYFARKPTLSFASPSSPSRQSDSGVGKEQRAGSGMDTVCGVAADSGMDTGCGVAAGSGTDASDGSAAGSPHSRDSAEISPLMRGMLLFCEIMNEQTVSHGS